MKKTFSICQALSFGFSAFFQHIVLLLAVGIVYCAVALAIVCIVGAASWFLTGFEYETIAQLQTSITEQTLETYSQQLISSISVGAIVAILTMLLAGSFFLYALSLGFLRIFLDIYEFDSSSISQLFSCFNRVPKLFVADTLFGILAGVAFMLLFVPGLIVTALYGFYRLYLIETNNGILHSFKYSSNLAQGALGRLVGFYFIVLIIASICVIFPPLYLITIPSLALARVFVYKKLQEQTV